MISKRIKLSFYGFCLVILALFATEHLTKHHYPSLKPSIFIKFVGDFLENIFTEIGHHLAYFSSFYTYIKLEDLYDTFLNLINPVIEVVGSPVSLLKGYLEVSLEYKYPFLVVLGTITLIGLCYLVYKKKDNLLSKIRRFQTKN